MFIKPWEKLRDARQSLGPLAVSALLHPESGREVPMGKTNLRLMRFQRGCSHSAIHTPSVDSCEILHHLGCLGWLKPYK